MKLLEQIEGKRVQITCLKENRIDIKAIEEISQMEMDELMTIQLDDNVVYSCLNFISLSNRLESPISRFDFHMIIAQIAQMHRIAKHMEWKSTDIIWNPDYVYMSPTTREVKFIYLPNNDIESNSITFMLERIIYSAMQTNPEDTFLSEFVYYLKRLGSFTSEDIIEFIKEEDSKVTRLLQLNSEITYTKPEKKQPPMKEEKELDIPNFTPREVVLEEESEEIQLETDAIPDTKFNMEDALDFLKTPETVCDVEEIVIDQPEEGYEEENTEEVEEAAEPVQPRLSFLDLFNEDSFEDDSQEDSFYDIDLDEDRALVLEEEFKPEQEELINSMVQETVEEEPVSEQSESLDSAEEVFEELSKEEVEDEESTQEMHFSQSIVDEIVLPKEENTEPKTATLTRLSTNEKAIIDTNDYVLGKSNFVNGMVIKGNPGVSRKHAMIRLDNEQYFIRDLDSVNGTYVNDVFVEPETEVELLSGDSIKLGDEEFLFTIE
ncbi:MAG: FHA domain-containing protein [Bacillota bacterium]|nr:FHA domain-containing protein [Bacillota bacterium]